ncbi:hypothetical protein DS745_03530 [Anaerobacillus alkaliphilus]|uniref:Uncharacterized protein n=1 Tax=Anaerobacillus alkaliphilus TaxID=1548597 RepID=A0A4Q0VZM7_9BACI|nr:hypothetical protein [Anaerobacillus alkaliphilus]RXJ04468.1 hypothetical protein DS745_03530 [Anaerobacillus alkaliphilus]
MRIARNFFSVMVFVFLLSFLYSFYMNQEIKYIQIVNLFASAWVAFFLHQKVKIRASKVVDV